MICSMVGRFSATRSLRQAKGLFRVSDREPQFLDIGTNGARRRIAYVHEPARAPSGIGLFWLAGYKSDMASTKATEIARYARETGLGSTRFDYSGHGLSSGKFEDGTIGAWLDEAEAVFLRVTRGPQIVIGSSMGAHIALLLLRRLLRTVPVEAERITALLLIAPAWDMTEELMWKQLPEDARREIVERGVYLQPSEYGEPYAITRALIEDGRAHLLARAPFDPGRPVVILQGRRDEAVPLAHARELLRFLKGRSVKLIEIADGEHRLSRPQDLALLFATLTELAESRHP
jgi:pimeloyl-ACP methyl ester carboxylesterase